MEFLINAFHLLLYQPLFNALILLYQFIPGQDFGVAIIVLTILIKILLYPLTSKAIQFQKTLIEIQPKIQELQQKFKNDKEKQVKEMMALYQKEKINPFSGFLPILIQIPILIALFKVFSEGLNSEQMIYLYNFVPYPGAINFISFGIINLSQSNIFLAILTAIAQFFQTKRLAPKIKKNKNDNQMAQISLIMQKQMLYLMPIFTLLFLSILPSALGLYWLVITLFSIGQHYLILKQQNAKP